MDNRLDFNIEYGEIIKKLDKTNIETNGLKLDFSNYKYARIETIKRVSGRGIFPYIGASLSGLLIGLFKSLITCLYTLLASLVIMPLSWFLFFNNRKFGFYSGDYSDFIIKVIFLLSIIICVFNIFKENGGRYYSRKSAAKKVEKLCKWSGIITIIKAKENKKYIEQKNKEKLFITSHPEYECISYDKLLKDDLTKHLLNIIFFEKSEPADLLEQSMLLQKKEEKEYELWEKDFEKREEKRKVNEANENLSKLVELEEKRLEEQKRHNDKVEWDIWRIKNNTKGK